VGPIAGLHVIKPIEMGSFTPSCLPQCSLRHNFSFERACKGQVRASCSIFSVDLERFLKLDYSHVQCFVCSDIMPVSDLLSTSHKQFDTIKAKRDVSPHVGLVLVTDTDWSTQWTWKWGVRFPYVQAATTKDMTTRKKHRNITSKAVETHWTLAISSSHCLTFFTVASIVF
jgi:hypothetical protein